MKQRVKLLDIRCKNTSQLYKSIRLISMLCIFLVAGPLFSENSFLSMESKNVESVIKNVVDRHPSVLSAVAQIKSARLDTQQQYMFFLPFSADISANTYGSIEDPDFNYTASFTMNYTLFDWGTIQEVRRLKLLEKVSIEYEKSIRQVVTYKLCNLIINWISSTKNYNLALQDYNSLKIYTGKMKQRFDLGDISIIEMYYANGSLLKAERLLVSSEYRIKEAEYLYKAETGETISEVFKSIQFAENVFLETESAKLAAIVNRPDIKQSALLIDALQQEKNAAYSNTIPVIKLSTTLKYPFDNASAWQAGLSLSIPLSSIRYDYLRDKQYSISLINKKNELKLFIENSMSNLLLSEEKIRSLKKVMEIDLKAVEYAKKTRDGVLIEFKAGIKTSFDVIDAQNNFSIINSQMLSSEIELLKAELNYQYAVGGLYFE